MAQRTMGSDGPGRGSEFVVRLPVLLEEQAAPPGVAGRDEPLSAVASLRILVVDDKRGSRRTLLFGMIGTTGRRGCFIKCHCFEVNQENVSPPGTLPGG